MPAEKRALVAAHRRVADGLYEMEVIAPQTASQAKPGQFVHIRPGFSSDPLLRRPLSLYDVDQGLGSITLLYKVVGRGTDLLSRVKSREYVDLMGPLGRGFTIPRPGRKTLLVGGGVGIAPLIYLARVLKQQGNSVRAAFGAASGQDAAVYRRKYEELGVEAWPATIDGTLGHQGTVLDLLKSRADPAQIDMIYTCGPEGMMEAVTDYARSHGIPGEVSLEEVMACGVGACLGCARKLKPQDEEYVKVCKDGPVFNMNLLA